TQETALRAEEILQALSPQAKQHKLLCAAHAHIDMNWMWRWDETVAVTLDTFRTVLALLRAYPQFKFSQSQASVYQIVETYAPELLPEIKQRIHEGRWEVTASTWVEADKNLPNGESQARHLLLTRRYLSQLLGLKPENFGLDFEPDTFGHSANVPEILASAGVKYYYHCRGDKNPGLYHWLAPSGSSILVYLEPFWYLGYVDPSLAQFVPSFCQQFGLDTALRVYGIGDHGGGPTRRDIQRILDMDTWPVFPTLRFGTFTEYFAHVEKIAGRLPEVRGELNFVFTGCYSSQSRIKKANRLAEAALDVSERFSALAATCGAAYPRPAFTKAWRNTLFNQFHDIIPGSGVIDTREYALGLFQESLALANSQRMHAFQNLLPTVELDAQQEGAPGAISEGAGVGFGVEQFRASQVSRGRGAQRMFHIFNPSPWPRRQVVEITVWDWDDNLQRLAFQDAAGQPARHQLLDQGFNEYWGHRYLRVLVEVAAPACGYTSLVLNESNDRLDSIVYPNDPRTEEPQTFLLENQHVRARFDPHSFALVSLIDKASGEELVAPERQAVFRLIREDDRAGMTAWTVGRYMQLQPLVDNARLLKFDSGGPLRQSLAFEIAWGASRLNVTVALDADSSSLDYTVECDWHEIGRHAQGVPQLNFCIPLNFACRAYRYDIPFGTIQRQPIDQDVPANSWGSALGEDKAAKKTAQLVSEGSYAFRGVDDSLALTLLRSSYDPDPYPEIGVHQLRFAVNLAEATATNKDLISAAYDYTHPLDVISGSGIQPTTDSFISLESGTAAVSAIKVPEEGEPGELVVRVYETEGQAAPVKLKFNREVLQAALVDLHEQPLKNAQPLRVSGSQVSFEIDAHRIATLRLKLAKG
ncbi:MAG: glycoside hydrolase family 38 C-terminal domain-containing protein, partial [Anaerolineaceae bacterium]